MTGTRAAVVALLAILSRGPDAALAACGDGAVDGFEQCDHGPANGADGCCSATCNLVDADGDGSCDAVDACADYTRIKDATLAVSGLARPWGEGLRFAGTMTVPNENTLPPRPPIDPSISGVTLRMFAPFGDPRGTTVAAVNVPGGAGWIGRADGTAWNYRDPHGTHGGVTRVGLKLLPPLAPTAHLTKVAFVIVARRGSFPITPAMVTVNEEDLTGSTLQVTLALGAPGSPLNTQCASVFYSTIQLTRCSFAASGHRVTCAGPPPVGPCHVGDPDDLIVCDTINAAAAEYDYFAATGAYYVGPCSGLPGFVSSPGVTCTTGPAAGSFTVSASHPNAFRSCTWLGNPSPGVDYLTCS